MNKPTSDRSPPKLPLSFVLAVPFVVLVAAAVGLTGGLSALAGRASVDSLARELQTEVSQNITHHLGDYLSAAHLINGLNLDAIRDGESDAKIPVLARRFVSQIRRFDSVVSICYANEKGDYVGPARGILGIPLGLGISDAGTGHALTGYSIDAQGKVQEKVRESVPGYDPRSRPWYRAAVEAKGPAWTPIFVWPTGDIGLDAVLPVYTGDALAGVLDVSLTLGKIGEFIKSLGSSMGANVFILERSGLLVASTAEEPFIREGDAVSRLPATDSRDPIERSAAEVLSRRYGGFKEVPEDARISLQTPEGSHFMQVIAYRDGYGLDWLVVTTIPETRFMSRILVGGLHTLAVVLGSTILAMALAVIVARWVTRPILTLNDTARRLAAGDFARKAPITRGDEIGELTRAFNSMGDRLLASFTSLRASEERYRKLFDGLPVGLFRSTPSGRLLDVNPAVVRILAFPDRSTLLAYDVSSLYVDAADRDTWRARLEREGTTKDHEVRLRRFDGEVIWVRITSSVVRGSDGEILFYDGSLEEITERVRVEEALRESEEKFRILSDQSEIGISIVQNGIFTYVNPAFTDSTGFRIGDPAFQHGYRGDTSPADPKLVDALKRLFLKPDEFGKSISTPSVRLRTPMGEDRYYNVYLKALRLGGKPAGMTALVDITEEKLAREKAAERQVQLIQSEKLASLGILAAGVAHEISNPNQAILLSGQVIKDAWSDAGSVLESKAGEEGDYSLGGIPFSQARVMIPNCLSAILECSQKIETIVNDLKGFARQDQAGAFRPIDLNMVIKSSLTLCANMLKKSTDHLAVRLAPDLPPVNGSFQRLEQVVINLIQNACQALPDRSRGIDISTRYEAGTKEVILVVADQGVGIPPENLPRVGNPFFTTKRESGGTGLGLSICNSIVQEHGGRMRHTSLPGEGTKVRVFLRRIE